MFDLVKITSLKVVQAFVVLIIFLFAWVDLSFGANAKFPDCPDRTIMARYRGINVSFHTNPTRDDFEKLSTWNVNLIRLVLHTDPKVPQYRGFFEDDSSGFRDEAFLALDRTINLASVHGIKVLIDMHTAPGVTNGELWEDYAFWEKFEALWTFIAERYKGNPSVIGYDLLNEPNLVIANFPPAKRRLLGRGEWSFPDEWRGTPRDYFALMTRVSQAINRIDPKMSIVVEGVGLWGNPINFNWMEIIDACNVVYSFHFYVPHKFTHAGRGKNSPALRYDPQKDQKRILAALKPVEEFSQKYGVPIFVGEFGLNYHNEERGAKEWLEDVLGFFEQKGWSWTYWTYSIDFRNPEVILQGSEKKLSQATDRLSVLKSYWDRNQKRFR